MNRYLQIGLSLLLILVVSVACHDESEEVVELSTLELVKSGKKKPKMVYSTGEKKGHYHGGHDDEEEQVKLEKLELTLEVKDVDLHIHCKGFMESAYLFIQDQYNKVIFTQNIELIDEDHPFDIFIPAAEDYPYYLQIESEKFFAKINIWLE